MGLVILFSAFTSSRPSALLTDDKLFVQRLPREFSRRLIGTLASDSDGDTLVSDKPDLKGSKYQISVMLDAKVHIRLWLVIRLRRITLAFWSFWPSYEPRLDT